MSFFNLKHRPQGGSGWDGMRPPELTLATLLDDLRWQLALYRADKLPFHIITTFLALRILHLVQYHRGWSQGAKDA